MFRSTAEFDKEVHNVLVKIRNGEDWEESTLDELAFEDVVSHMITNRYVTGIKFLNLMGGKGISGIPRITRSGLQFIETFRT